jgi:hypothetical protein
MSNHLPFEDWLFSDEPLDPQQNRALQGHLEGCLTCREKDLAWHEVETRLKAAPVLSPAPGFTMRWQARLAAERLRKERRQTLNILLFSLGGAGLLLFILAWLVLPALRSPEPLFWASVYRLFSLFTLANLARDSFFSFIQSITGVVPLTLWILFAGLVSELAVLWIVTLRLLTKPRRVTL